MSRRTERINELLRKEISRIMARELNDPRLSMLVTITRADVTSDLRKAQIYVSILGTNDEQISTIEMLRAAAGFFQRELKPRLTLKYVPYLSFRLDDSIKEGMRMLNLMDSMHAKPRPIQ